MPQHPAVETLHRLTQRFPFIWKNYAAMQELRRRYRANVPATLAAVSKSGFCPDWPDWCWCPSSTEPTMLTPPGASGPPLDMPEDFPNYTVGALAAWRPTQGIYRFDFDLFEALLRTPVTSNIPSEALKRLPAWGVYIEVPEKSKVLDLLGCFLHGYFAYLDYEPISKTEMFSLILLVQETYQRTDDYRCVPLMFPITGTIEQGLLAMEDGSLVTYRDIENRKVVHEILALLMSPVLYLCAEEADVPQSISRPERVVKTKKGRHISPIARRPMLYDCGVRVGAQLRQARAQHEKQAAPATAGRSVQPHIRAAHWHTFLTGPRDRERVAKVKWLPPIPVKLEGTPEVATVHPVHVARG